MTQPHPTPNGGLAFPLLEDVVVLADVAMRLRQPQRIVRALTDGLRGALKTCGALPPLLLQTDSAGYVRRELYRSAEFGYQILALTWGPGQGSPVHDHADTWGVEAVLRGRLQVTDYRARHRNDALAQLRATDSHELVDGSVIGLLPPHDLHACSNPSADEVAVSLHIYGTTLEGAHRFVHVDGDTYRPERVVLRSV